MPPNDPNITDDQSLWRRVPPNHVIRDKTTGKILRVASAAFKDGHRALSVDIATRTTIERILRNYPSHGLADFSAGDARTAECGVTHDPKRENDAHALVHGKHKMGTGRLTDGQANELKKKARLIVDPKSGE